MTRPGSLGRRLSSRLALQSLGGLSIICTAVFLDARSSLAARQTEALASKRIQVMHLIAEAGLANDLSALKHKLDDSLVGHAEVLLTVRDQSGRVLYASGPQADATTFTRKVEFDAPSLRPALGPMSASLALDTRDDDEFLRRLGFTLLSAAVGGAALASLAGFWQVRLGLRPVRDLAEQTRALAADTLDRRLSSKAQPEELRPLVEQFNDLLGRLELAYERVRGFNADVAHELCTPLATLISSSELALRRQRGAAELRDVVGSNLEELHRLAGIVQDMLFLSQADRGARARRVSTDSLARELRPVAEFHEAAVAGAGLRLQFIGDATGAFDVPLLKRAVSNLLSNAVRYAWRGTCITIEINDQRSSGVVYIAVKNAGPRIESHDLPRIFDRFYRVDKSRADAATNHGLGLSIVAAIARMHDGNAIAKSDDQETSICLFLAAHAVPPTSSNTPPHQPGGESIDP